MNNIISSEYYEQRCDNYLNKDLKYKKVKKIKKSGYKNLLRTKEIHTLDNGIKITILNLKNAIHSVDLKIKIKINETDGYEFMVHMYKLNEGSMVKEEPVYIGNVDKHEHCELDAYDNRIGIGIDSLKTNIMMKDVYGHIIAISGFLQW